MAVIIMWARFKQCCPALLNVPTLILLLLSAKTAVVILLSSASDQLCGEASSWTVSVFSNATVKKC